MILRKLPRLKSLSPGTFCRVVFPLSCLIALLFIGNTPVSAHSFAPASQPAQDPTTTACSAPIARPVGAGSIVGGSCFHDSYPPTIVAEVTVSFFSPQPEQWQQCKVNLETIDTSDGNAILQGTEQQYDCLQDAKNSRTVVYGNDWWNLVDGSFLPVVQHSYQVVADVEYSLPSSSSQELLLESQIYTP